MPVDSISFDYHSHHYRCGHAQGGMADYIEAAIAREMVEFGVSDHGPAYFLAGDHALPGTQMALSELPAYVDEAFRLQSEYADRIAVRVGIEADFVDGYEERLRDLLDSAPFDYALGSVHYVNQISVFSRQRWATENAADTYASYYESVKRAARSGLFNILSHLSVVEAYGPPVSDALAERLYPPVAAAVAESGCIVEVNTSGYRKMGGDDPFPNRRLLRLLIQAGVPLTFGSDCHRPEEVGFARDQVLALLRDLGVRGLADGPECLRVRRGGLLVYRTR